MKRFKIEKLHKLILNLERIQTTRAKRLFKIVYEEQPIQQNRIFPLMGDPDNSLISRELQYLVDRKMVKVERIGKYKFYEVDIDGVEELQKAIAGI